MGKGKKGKMKADENWEDDLAEIAKESGINLEEENSAAEIAQTFSKKKEKKKKHKIDKDDDEGDAEEETGFSVSKGNMKASFNALMIEEDAPENDDTLSDDEDEPILDRKPDDYTEHANSKESKGKSKKQKAGKDGRKAKTVIKEEEDISAILADLEIDEKSTHKKEKKKGKKKNKETGWEGEISADHKEQNIEESGNSVEQHKENFQDQIESAIDDHDHANNDQENQKQEIAMGADDHPSNEANEEEGPKIKTAAQKKAEKKEREKEKKKKESEKKKKAQTKASHEVEAEKIVENVAGIDASAINEDIRIDETHVVAAKTEGNVVVEESGEEGEVGDEEKKKKKKKKKKGKEEDDKKKGKKPGKAAIKQMQEALEKVKQEEERLKKEEEAKQHALEEAEKKREEKIRLEKERKEKKKQKDKEKRERMKKEGKLLTPAQKEQKRRAELMLEAMKAQGISVPSKDITEQRERVQYGSKKKTNKQMARMTSEESEKDGGTHDEEMKVEIVEKVEELPVDESTSKEETVKDKQSSLDSTEDQADDVKDSWDVDSEDESKEIAIATKEVQSEDSSKIEKVVSEDREESRESASSSESESSSGSEEEDSEEESSDEESESEEEHEKLTPEKIKAKARERIMNRRAAAEQRKSVDKLRCPVICVLGHVDTGKTKLLDKIRHTNVQDGEAGGITQQIGATLVPYDAIRVQTKMLREFQKFDLKLPGLLIIDTPGHESFSNLRTRGSSLCDMAILVVDIMHGLEPQTIESINLLRKKQTPFIVALNKVDRLFEWKRSPTSQFEDTIKKQKKNTKSEFEERADLVIREFSEQGLNAALFYKNIDEKNFISLVPTSAHSGDGMGDLIALICRLTQTRMAKKLAFSDEVQSTVMEVKSLPGLGTTIDAILVNGKLREGDTIVTGGIEGPIVTQIRAILTPQPLRELRVKSNYIQHKELEAAQGCKVTGKDLEKVMAGAPIFVAEHPDEIEVFKDEVNEIVKSSLQAIKLSERGVYVQASTLGSLEALLEFLKTSKIPYSGVNIGPVHKKDVMKTSVMLEHEPMFAVILAFDVKIERDAQELADKEGLKIFCADIIYHLFDKFTAYTEDYKQKQKEKHRHVAVFPCKLRILPQHIFNSRDPIVVGVNIEAGIVRLGTPLTVPSKEFCDIGVVTGIEANHKNMERATAGQEVCIKIEPTGEAPKMYGRHFTYEDSITSKISRESIDALKKYFRDEMSKNEWQLVIELKKIFNII